MAEKRFALLFSGFMFLLASVFLVYSFLHDPSSATLDTSVGIMFYPRIILSLWFILAAILFIRTIRGNMNVQAVNWRLSAASIALVLLVCILLAYTGFLPACIIFCALYPFVLGYKKFKILIPVSIFFAIGVWFIFNKVLFILLPEMPWF